MDVLELASPATAGPAGLLGIWALARAPAFGAETRAPAPARTEWRARFSADPVQALALATVNQSRLDRAQGNLARADARLDAFIRGRGTAAAFGSGAMNRLEAELNGLLAESRGGAAPPVAFWPGQGLLPRWDEIGQRFRQFLDQLNRLVLNYAYVETYVEDRFIARTTVGWSGEFQSEWGADIGPSHSQLHLTALNLALKSRATLLDTFLTTVSGALKLTAILTMPGGFLLALPAAWHFIQTLLDE